VPISQPEAKRQLSQKTEAQSHLCPASILNPKI